MPARNIAMTLIRVKKDKVQDHMKQGEAKGLSQMMNLSRQRGIHQLMA